MNPTVPLRVIIVEDLPLLREGLEDLLAQQSGFTLIGACATVHDALVLIHATKPDLLLLDIGLPDGTGFDILEQMRPVQSKVIFITAYREYAKAFRCGAIDYLLKPLDPDEFRDALQRVPHAPPLEEQITITLQCYQKQRLQDHLALRSQHGVQIVELKDICYLQADDGYTTVFLNGGKKMATIKPLKYYEELLPGTSFLRTHQSYLVNKFYIRQYRWKNGLLFLKDGTQIPLSIRKKKWLTGILELCRRYV